MAQRVETKVLEFPTPRMEELVRTLSELKENPASRREDTDPNRLIENTLSEMQLSHTSAALSVSFDEPNLVGPATLS